MIKRITSHPLFKSSLIYTISDGINKSVPFFILPILSHYLLPSDYGIVANFGVLLGIITLLISLSIEGFISVNYHKLNKEKIGGLVFNSVFVSFISFCVLTIITLIFNNYIYKLVDIPIKYQFLCVIMAFMNLFTSINLVLWRLEEKPIKFGLYDISNTVINIGFSLIFIIILGQKWEGRINGMAVAMISYGVFSFAFLIKRKYLKFKFEKSFLKEALIFGIPLLPHALSFWIRSGIDRVFITKMWGTDSVGLYATGFQFGLLVSFLVMAFNNAFSPFLYKTLSITSESQLKLEKLKIVKITYLIMIGLFVAGLLFIVFSKFIILHLFSDKYSQAIAYVNWAILAQVFQGFYVLFVNYIFYVKKTKELAAITISCAMLQVILSYFLIKIFGPIGGAYSTVIISIVNFVAVMMYSKHIYQMPWSYFLKK